MDADPGTPTGARRLQKRGLLGGDGDVAARRLGRGERVVRAQRGAARPAPRRPSCATPADDVWPRGVAPRTRSSTSTASLDPAARAGSPRTRRRRSAPARRPRAAPSRQRAAVSLMSRSPSRSPRSMLNALMWSRSSTATASGESLRRARASSRGSSSSNARRVTRPVSASLSASACTRARSPACSIAIAACAATSRSTALGRVGQRVQRALPDHDQHAGDLAVAQHGLEDGRARARGLDQRRRQRRVVAGVGDEVRLLGGERAAAGRASPRGWIVTGCDVTPAIAVEPNSRPDGSSRNATGASITSQAASQMAVRASSPPASALATRPIAPIPLAPGRAACR